MTNYQFINNEIMSNNQNRSWTLGFGIYFVILVWSLVIVVTGGCARTVTQIVAPGDEMVVEVTLGGNLNADTNRYFLVVSSSESYRIPLPPPDQIDDAPEFIEPGTIPTTGTVEAYYTNFYSTWAGYIILDRGQYYLVKGPFELNQTPTREPLSALGEISAKISFSFQLERIFENIDNIDNIYFDFIAVPWPDGAEKIPSDHLPSTNNYISNISGSTKTVEDAEDSELNLSLDILDCRVEIQ